MTSQAYYLIGIDPGASTGVCLYNRKNKTFSLHTISPWEIIDLIDDFLVQSGDPPDRFHVVIEDPRQNATTFRRNVSMAELLKIAQNVGSNKRDTDWLEYLIQSIGLKVTLVKPVKGNSKWNRKTVKNLTGYKGQSNEHTRDALRMVWGL